MSTPRKTSLDGLKAMLGAAAGLAEALDVSQDVTLSRRERAAAWREVRGYKKKLASLGVEVFFLDDGAVPVAQPDEHIIRWVMLTSKRPLSVEAASRLVSRGKSLEGKLSPLYGSILVTPVRDPTGRPNRS